MRPARVVPHGRGATLSAIPSHRPMGPNVSHADRIRMNAVFAAHSGNRYLVLLAAAVALAVLLYGSLTHKPYGRGARISTAAFTGLLDLQFLLGVILVALGRFYGALIGHIMMMLLAVAVAHGTSVMARKRTDHRQAHTLALVGVVLALVLIWGGVSSIGRTLFQSTVGGASAPAAETTTAR